MRNLAIFAVLVTAIPAAAKPWQGIEPGVSKRDEVIQKFKEPSRVVTTDNKEVIAYFGVGAIKGTTQAQFRVDPTTKLVERIDVFPGPVIDKETIENSYGPACPSGPQPANPCYVKKMTDEFRTYFLYQKLGLAIFFNEDGKTVHSFIFTTLKAAK
ncbi:hypothetical protein [Hyalangium rubrum]|uniref:Uncharacterized protein n=1 Tax=Hyalangium rubrum TaxID=3103134 RepID=A0ABU5GUB6_9BACT|nr:hypothetical protein [Hyalangium sp. s54d21]MDY7224766.1 hypothetical protein [Hyalangium sp. s54d21]